MCSLSDKYHTIYHEKVCDDNSLRKVIEEISGSNPGSFTNLAELIYDEGDGYGIKSYLRAQTAPAYKKERSACLWIDVYEIHLSSGHAVDELGSACVPAEFSYDEIEEILLAAVQKYL
jgi:hypothetical protein